jgi:hypothetical protein
VILPLNSSTSLLSKNGFPSAVYQNEFPRLGGEFQKSISGKPERSISEYRNQPPKSEAFHLSFSSIPCFILSLHLLTSPSVMNKSPSAQNAKATEPNVPSSKRTPSKEQPLQHQQQLNPNPQHQNPTDRPQSATHQPTHPASQTALPQAQVTQPTAYPHTHKKPSNSACWTLSSFTPG